MFKRTGMAVLLMLGAAQGWGYEVSAFFDGQGGQRFEGDGVQTVSIELARELDGQGLPIDPEGSCLVDVVVRAGPFSSSVPGQATPDVDYSVIQGQTVRINILGDQLAVRATLDVTVIDDNQPEDIETFAAEVIDVIPVDCAAEAQFTRLPEAAIPIIDDDVGAGDGFVEFAEPAPVVGEGDGIATIVVNRVDGGEGAISYDYFIENFTASEGEDFTSVSGTLQWENGDTSPKSFTIPILDDEVVEDDEALDVFVSGVEQSPLVARLTIVDDDEPSVVEFTQTLVSVREDVGTVEITATRTGSAGGAVSAEYATADVTALAGEDYVEALGSFDWADGETGPKTVAIQIVPGSIGAADESFSISLLEVIGPATIGQAATATVTIAALATGEVAFATAPLSVAEGAGVAVITVNRINGSDGVLTIPYFTTPETAVPDTDYTPVTGTLQWADGDAAPKTFEVPIIDDVATDGNLTLRVGLSLGDDATLETQLTIVDDDAPSGIGFAVTDLEVDEDAGSVLATVSRVGGAAGGAVTVDFATVDGTALAGEDYTAASGTLTWEDGDSADQQIEVEILAGGIDGEAEAFTIVLANVTGPATLTEAATATVSILPLAAERDISGIDILTPNQRQLANWFDQTCPRLTDLEAPTEGQAELTELCGLVRDSSLPDSDLQQILDAINPEEIFAASTSALRLTAAQHGNLSQRINALRNGARGVDLSGLNLQIGDQLIAGEALQAVFDELVGGGASGDDATWGRWGAFLNGRLSTGEKDETANESGFDYDLHGITLGVDYRIRDNLIFGLAGGFGGVDSDYHGNGGGLDIESWSASAFLTYFRDETFYADAMLTYGENDYDSSRNIRFDAGNAMLVDRTAKGDTDGTQLSAGFGLGWDFSSDAWTWGPHAGLYHYRVEVDGFAESGAGGLDLVIGDQEVKSLTGNAGGHVSYAVLTSWGVLLPNARVDWVREFEDGSESLSYAFRNDPFTFDPNDPSPTITLRSDRPDSSYFIMAAGVSAQFIHGISGFVNYQTYSGYSDFTINEWNFGLRWEKTY